MNKLYALISVAVVLSACSQESSAPAPAPAPAPAATAPAAPAPTAPPAAAPEATAPAPAATPSAATSAAAPTASADLPQECQDYLNKVSACVSKQSGAAADAMKASLEQTKAAWAAYGSDKSQFVAACKTANDAFAAQATAMKC